MDETGHGNGRELVIVMVHPVGKNRGTLTAFPLLGGAAWRDLKRIPSEGFS